jgi:hypothetical protein
MYYLLVFVEDKLLGHNLEDIHLVVEEDIDYNQIVLVLLVEELSAFQYYLRALELELELRLELLQSLGQG